MSAPSEKAPMKTSFLKAFLLVKIPLQAAAIAGARAGNLGQ
jgi:hypothetical protein